ncbi:MAG: 23S rRNA (uracil(1939)-C(5))-methyltransferase RlmD [Lachnospiraceae bacterium]|nr:23S rRNA (uracil(1939)-C(5))-methyltransferase RlmD [Lachnospiraceae bacterium]
MTYKKNDIVHIKISDISAEGTGIGKVDGYALFVKDALIGDEAEVRITKVKKSYGYARIERLIKKSCFRVKERCTIARQCGGCQIQALSYDEQLRFKRNKVRSDLIRLGGFDEEYIDRIMEPIIGMDAPWRYRNKAQFPIGTDKEGNPVAGFYAGRTHNIICNTECYLGTEENKSILDIILLHMKKYNISAYDENTGKGLIRHVLIRKGFNTGEIMVCIVINGRDNESEYIRGQKELLNEISRVPGVKSISVNINTEKTNVILKDEVINLYGSTVIHEVIGGIDFAISVLSFFQVNPVQMEKLYDTAIEYAGLTGKETVWDLYCGIGSISLFMARNAKAVYGVEVIPQAIRDAYDNAKRNHFENVKFFVGKAEEILPEFYNSRADDEMKTPDVMVVDPPRKGCDQNCLDIILKMRPNRIVYVSCDPATLARDLKILISGGYELKRVRPCDMFPHTVHVETVVLLSREKVDGYISIDLDVELFESKEGRA